MAAGEPHGLRLFGMRALMSLRLEKGYGTWFREYRPIYTPLEGGITRYIKLDHEFIGRAAHEAEVAAAGRTRRLVAFVVEPDPDDPADVIGDEPVWHDGEVVGWITSGGYGHHVEAVDRARLRARRELATPDGPAARGFEIEIIGRRRPARLQPEPLFDPPGVPDAPVTEAPGGGRRAASSSTAGRSRPAPATRSRSRSSAPARTRDAAGPCASPGDCGNCLAVVDGVAYVRTCQTAARPGAVVARHPADANPPLP